MAPTSAATDQVNSGDPALSETSDETNPSVATTRSVTLAGVSLRTLAVLVALVAAAAWGWASVPTSSGGTSTSVTYGPSSTALPVYAGPMRITSPMTISNVTINGQMEILAPVTMTNVNMNCATSYACIRVYSSGSLNITGFRIDGGGARSDQNSGGLNGDNITARNGEIVGVENGIVGGSNQLIEDVYIHDLALVGSGHPDGVQYDGGNTNIVLRRVRIVVGSDVTSAVMIDNYFGSSSGITLDSCDISGGGYTLYLEGQFSSSRSVSVSIFNTKITSGQWGPVLHRGPVTVAAQSGNTADGQPITF